MTTTEFLCNSLEYISDKLNKFVFLKKKVSFIDMLGVEGVFGYDILVTCLYLRVVLFKLFKLLY